MTSSIAIPVDAADASLFQSGPPQLRDDIRKLVDQRLKEEQKKIDERRQQAKLRTLEIMNEIGREAEARGLTDEILEELLRDES